MTRGYALSLCMTFGLVACGDNGSTSASGTQGTTTTATTATTDGTATATSPTTSASASTSDSGTGTASDTQGTTSPTTTSPTSTGMVSATATTTGTTDPGTGTMTSTSTSTSTSTTTGSTTDPDTTTGNGCQPGDTQGMGDVEKSYLWVASSDEGTVSKVDTQAVLEIGRYRTGPNGFGENPSRTAVSFDGRFVVVHGRDSGRSTVIAANEEDCVDKNGNGTIETSKGKADVLAWNTDECVVWSVTHPYNGQFGGGPRGTTWSPGVWNKDLCLFEHPVVWVGYLPPQNGLAHMARLDGATGALEETVVINNWFIGDTSWGPYGAALDKNLDVWTVGLRGELFRVNTAQNPATFDRWVPPNNLQIYGMTVDPDGDPWFGPNCGEITTFDPVNQQFISVAGTDACHRGLAADQDGSVWVADNSQCGVWQVDHKTNTLVQFHTLNPCSIPVGVSTDDEGFVWVVDESGWAWKIDPINPGMKQIIMITGDHYTYSDMTGGQVKSVVLPQ